MTKCQKKHIHSNNNKGLASILYSRSVGQFLWNCRYDRQTRKR